MSQIYHKLFSLIFIFLLLLAIFLIETEYKLYLFAAVSLFLMISAFILPSPQLDLKYQKQLRILSVLVGTFLIGMSVSVVFSHHYPLSLDKYTFYVVAMGVWWFFLRWPLSEKQRSDFVEYLLLLTLILNVFVLTLTFLPLSHVLFQGMNLLVRNYGHNHYAAFLLLVLPLIWWKILTNPPSYFLSSAESRVLAWLLLWSSYLLLILSFGRIALMIGMLQLLLIAIGHRELFYSLFKQAFVGVLFKLLLLAFIVISGLFLLLSLPILQTEQGCPLSFNRKDLCIAVNENTRFDYYRKALAIFRDNPLTGYGIKTFNFASRQYPHLGKGVSAYAHNIFLHNFAEMGIVGGLPFLGLIVISIAMAGRKWFYKLSRGSRTGSKSLAFFLCLAVFSSLINALFDFDWHFFVIFSLTLIFIALILQSDSVEVGAKSTPRAVYSRLNLLLLALLTVSLMLAYTVANYWQQQQDDRWLQLSFFDKSVRLPHKTEMIDKEIYKQQLSSLYRHDPEIWIRYLRQEEIDSGERLAIFLSLAQLDPGYFAKVVDFSLLSDEQALELVPVMLEVFEKYEMLDNVVLLDYWWQQDLSKQLFNLGERSFVAGYIGQSVVFYQAAYKLNRYVFGDHQPAFLQSGDLDKWERFISLMSDLPPHDSGNFYAYMGLSHQVVQKLFREQQFAKLKDFLRIVLNQEPPAKYYLLNSLRESGLYQAELADIYQEFDFRD